MRTAEQANQSNDAIQAQLLAAQLSEPMRRALLTAGGMVNRDDLTGETVLDYCPGHESLAGAHMGTSVLCEQPCAEAVAAYRAERTPDPDDLHVRVTDGVGVATVIALTARGILAQEPVFDEFNQPQRALTDLGYRVHSVLKVQATR